MLKTAALFVVLGLAVLVVTAAVAGVVGLVRYIMEEADNIKREIRWRKMERRDDNKK